jgi:pimeloyl-ACP methyl ester carboxylesterase
MAKKTRSHVEDLRGASRLAVEATKGITALVQEMHSTIGGGPAILGKPLEVPARLVTDVVYGSIRGVTSLVGVGIDRALEQLAPLLGDSTPGPEREAVLAALNGVLGDYLADTNNPLTIEMRIRHQAQPLELEQEALRAAFPGDNRKLLVLVHGSCMNDLQWCRAGHDHGEALAGALGYTPVYLHYNSGRHVSTNGGDFAALLDKLVLAWPTPLEQVVIVAHSMGGLVARSACKAAEVAGLAWREKLRAMVFLGTPHHGAPLERGGNWLDVLLGVSRYSAPLARLGKIRSAGVTDLRFGNLIDDHWQGRDRFELGDDPRSPLPLPDRVACYAVAGTTASGKIGDITGDGLVTVNSALGQHEDPEMSLAFPDAHKCTAEGVAHLDLLDRSDVYDTIHRWLAPT